LRIDIITIFPNIFKGMLTEGMLRIAQEKKLVEIRVHDLRGFTKNRHRQVDDEPYGGGYGMVMMVEPFYKAVVSLTGGLLEKIRKEARIIVFTPAGKRMTQSLLKEFAVEKWLVLLCGRYEGLDERIHQYIATDEVSLGDFILSGGEIPAMALIDGVCRLIPGVLGKAESLVEESFTESLLEYPQYTRPAKFLDWSVPDVLLSGNHEAIRVWRRKQRLKRTLLKRPDLLRKAILSEEDKNLLKAIEEELKEDQNLE
jgi:tRNA (guanine37-N1)-methyltransferase